jgi:hypothetical protein
LGESAALEPLEKELTTLKERISEDSNIKKAKNKVCVFDAIAGQEVDNVEGVKD